MQGDLVCTLMAEDMATADEEMEMATEYRDEYCGEQLEKLDVIAEGCPLVDGEEVPQEEGRRSWELIRVSSVRSSGLERGCLLGHSGRVLITLAHLHKLAAVIPNVHILSQDSLSCALLILTQDTLENVFEQTQLVSCPVGFQLSTAVAKTRVAHTRKSPLAEQRAHWYSSGIIFLNCGRFCAPPRTFGYVGSNFRLAAPTNHRQAQYACMSWRWLYGDHLPLKTLLLSRNQRRQRAKPRGVVTRVRVRLHVHMFMLTSVRTALLQQRRRHTHPRPLDVPCGKRVSFRVVCAS